MELTERQAVIYLCEHYITELDRKKLKCGDRKTEVAYNECARLLHHFTTDVVDILRKSAEEVTRS